MKCLKLVDQKIKPFANMTLWPSKTVRVLLSWLTIAFIMPPFVEGQQCNCASSVPACKPLPEHGSSSENSCVKVPRADCPCCLVCAGHLHEPCNRDSQPCDISKGLVCDSDNGLCKKGKPCPNDYIYKQLSNILYRRDDCTDPNLTVRFQSPPLQQ